MKTLTDENVHAVFLDCLFKEFDPTDNHVIGEAVMGKFGFNPEKLKKYDSDIAAMLDELPETFKKSGGGGWSFLNMCEDKNGHQWTGFHKQVDELVALGTATGKMAFLMPRELWGALPGGMPYLVIL